MGSLTGQPVGSGSYSPPQLAHYIPVIGGFFPLRSGASSRQARQRWQNNEGALGQAILAYVRRYSKAVRCERASRVRCQQRESCKRDCVVVVDGCARWRGASLRKQGRLLGSGCGRQTLPSRILWVAFARRGGMHRATPLASRAAGKGCQVLRFARERYPSREVGAVRGVGFRQACPCSRAAAAARRARGGGEALQM